MSGLASSDRAWTTSSQVLPHAEALFDNEEIAATLVETMKHAAGRARRPLGRSHGFVARRPGEQAGG